MDNVAFFASIACFGMIAYQDFRSRAFYTILIPLLIASNVVTATLAFESTVFWYTIKYNTIFIGLLMMALLLIMALREGSLKFSSPKIGWGDILLIITIIPLFLPDLFRLVFLCSALSGLIFGMLYKRIRNKAEVRVPLAGLMSVVCAGLLILDKVGLFNMFDPLI